MHLLPGSRGMGYKLVVSHYCRLRNGSSIFSSLCNINKCKYNYNFDISSQGQNLTSFIKSKNFHTCSRQNFDHDTEVGIMPISAKDLEIEERSKVFRSSLYPNSDDTIIMQLKACDSVSQVRRIINNNSGSLTSKHYCQFVLVLWDIMKNYSQYSLSHHTLYTNSAYNMSTVSVPNSQTDNVFKTVDENDIDQTITKALDHLSTDIELLRADELVLSVLYCSRLGIHLKNPSIQNMLQKIYKLLTREDCDIFPLHLLSRLTLIFADNEELWAKLFLIKTLPFIYKYFDECSNTAEFKALTISMISTLPYLKEELLVEFEALTDELLRNGILTKDQISTILKAIILLNNKYHKPSARLMIYRLMYMLNGQVNKLFSPHLLNLQRIALINLEPHFIITELENVRKTGSSETANILVNPNNFSLIYLPTNQKGSAILKDLISQTNQLDVLLSLYNHLTTAHLDLCHMFWDKMIQLFHTSDIYMLQCVCSRYISFTQRMGFYRHKKFESHILSFIVSELVSGSAAHRPYQFSLLAAFVLSYEPRQHEATSLSTNIIPHLLSMFSQFNISSCYVLSRVFRQATTYKRKKETLQAYMQLDSALNARVREIMESNHNLSIDSFNNLIRISINKKETLESDLVWDIMKRCEQLDWSELTSRSLRNLVYNFLSTNSLVPTALDQMAQYCLDNRHVITGDTAGKLTHLCYHLGHSPVYDSSFWALTADLVTRDYKHQNGLSLLQVALALSFFNHLPPSLNRIIFSVDFLERLDEEIKNCFSKDRYPIRVRQMLMQLNRSVCLDNPEADVPWFHSKYCEEQQSLGKLDAKPKSLLFAGVSKTLASLVGDAAYIGQNVFVPYGYSVDFQLNLDADLNPVPLRDSENIAHKLAMLLHYRDNYTMYEQKLKGYHQMKQRHLEILGYKVITLSDTLWNAMWMAEPTAKHEYLRNIIWPT